MCLLLLSIDLRWIGLVTVGLNTARYWNVLWVLDFCVVWTCCVGRLVFDLNCELLSLFDTVL